MMAMNSKYGSRTYGRSTKPDRGNLKFEQVLSESKPSTAKVSMTAVHRWGNTSYTSIRKTNVNGDSEDQPTTDQTIKIKKPRISSPVLERPISSSDPFDFDPVNTKPVREENISSSVSNFSTDDSFIKPVPVKAPAPKRNKFFKSRNLFDTLKNGPTYNNDKISYSDALQDDVSVPVAELISLRTPHLASDPITDADAAVGPVLNVDESLNHVKFKSLSQDVNLIDSASPSERVQMCENMSSDNSNVLSDNNVVSTNIDSSTGTSDSQDHQIEVSGSMSQDSDDVSKSEKILELTSQESKTKPVKKFFMNRQKKSANSPSKSPSKALFNMKLWEHEDDLKIEEESQHSSQPSTLSDTFSSDFDEVEVPSLRRYKSEPARPGVDSVTSVRCSRGQKPLYTVVRNVKQAHQCHESGETQEFNDDIDYLIDGLEKYNSTGTRCLSALSLATKCMIPSFRMHLRAHGTIPKLFSALQDAPSDPNVAFCSATLMFVLSQDRLNMDLDSSMLELMLQLLEINTQADMSKSGISNKELQKNKEKVRSVCEQMQQKSHAKHLNLGHITTGELAMETLLTLTSKRAGEWFKEEIRELGGLDHIVKTVSICTSVLDGDLQFLTLDIAILEKLGKVSRCFRVLENVTHQNADNQGHLISVNDGTLVASLIRLLHVCDKMFPLNNVSDIEDVTVNADHPGVILFNCLQSTLRVLVNLTNNNASTSSKIGIVPGVIDLGLNCVLKLPAYVPSDKKFDLCVLSLGLLINLVESSEVNRKLLMETETVLSAFDGDELRAPAMEALVQLFTEKFEEARQSEEQTDKLLGDTEKQCEASAAVNDDVSSSQQAETTANDIEETLMKALKKAGKHMEHSIVGAYTALLVGFVIQNNSEYTDIVREYLPEGNYKSMVKLLRTLFNFMILTVAPGNAGVKTVKQILDVLEAS